MEGGTLATNAIDWVVVLYLGAWMMVGFAALVVGVMVYPRPQFTIVTSAARVARIQMASPGLKAVRSLPGSPGM